MRPVSNFILLCMIELRSSNTCVPSGELASGVSRVGMVVLTDVATVESFYRCYLPFQRSDQDRASRSIGISTSSRKLVAFDALVSEAATDPQPP